MNVTKLAIGFLIYLLLYSIVFSLTSNLREMKMKMYVYAIYRCFVNGFFHPTKSRAESIFRAQLKLIFLEFQLA